jgi:cytochrome c oxidase subunit III
MATFPTTVPVDVEPIAGRGGAAPPSRGSDGGDGNGGPFDYGSGAFELRLRRARLGMIVAISAIAMIFVSFTSAYVVRQGLPTIDPRTGTLVHDWLPVRLPPLLLLNTLVLLVSSVTMELSRRQIAREAAGTAAASALHPNRSQISWLALTIALGLAFLAGQLVAWRELAATGFYLATSPSSSFVYLLTGMHGIHLLGAVFVLLFAGAAAVVGKPIATRVVILDVTGWYWHFMAILWVYVFCLMKFAR